MNTSMESEFVLHCVVDSSQRNYTIAALIFIYLISICSNLLVFLVIVQNHQLQTPMFLLIATLAILDILNSTNLIPRMVAALISDYLAVPYGPCILQIHVEAHILAVGTLTLSLMAADRYVAVVYPLRYPSVITNQTVLVCILLINVIAVIFVIPLTVLLTELPFCQVFFIPRSILDRITLKFYVICKMLESPEMNTSVESVSEFVLHCTVESSQKNYRIAGLNFMYLATLSNNLLVFLVIMQNHQLQTPMFLYIATLAILDLLNSTNIIP
ncbi:olfactory receptor 1D2-like [Polypterus senegalus]|uniref:olfactory receptor 1D2-like n=1 Tax=Polypterus senegalus TaxID=55291 RepID=UPI0019659969|nr:olfactory receptor 1D2-like [Polypterus senegalus]